MIISSSWVGVAQTVSLRCRRRLLVSGKTVSNSGSKLTFCFTGSAKNKFVDSKLAPCLNPFLPTLSNSLITVQLLLRNPELRPIAHLVRV